MSINPNYAQSQQFTHNSGEYSSHLFFPQFYRWRHVPPPASRVLLKIWVVRCATVDESLLKGLDYSLYEILLDEKQ